MFTRVIPFILTFAVGLFIASFFVNVIPTFKVRKDSCRKHYKHKMMKQENKRLRWENEQLRRNRMNNADEMMLLDEMVPPPAPLAPR